MNDSESPPGIFLRSLGPRTDVRYMTRRELFRSSGQFLLAGIVVSAAVVLTGSYAFRSPGASAPAVLLGLFYILSILAAMGLAGSLYMAVRGILRGADYDPAAVLRADIEAWVERGGDEGLRFAIELHDSTATAVEARDDLLIVHLEAIVHQSEGEPGAGPGTCHIYPAEMRFLNSRVGGRPVLPLGLTDGRLHLGDLVHSNMIPVPLEYEGQVRLELEGWNEGGLVIEAARVRVALVGCGKYLETFTPSEQP